MRMKTEYGVFSFEIWLEHSVRVSHMNVKIVSFSHYNYIIMIIKLFGEC